MFCPQCGHEQLSNDMRFCSRCGLPLGIVSDLLLHSSENLQREKRQLTGIALMMATVIMLLNFLIVFGVTTLPHLGVSVFFWVWLSFVVTALIIGGLGLTNLIRGGFFKRLKEREAQLQLMKSDRDRQQLPEAVTETIVPATAHLVQPLSVTETTTRELETPLKP